MDDVTRPRHSAPDYGFPPVAAGAPRVLILGSLPGRVSLEQQRYYAQPHNSFWRIMGELVGAAPELAYEARLERLTRSSIALWDVLAAGVRPGSLDASIVRSSAVFNDFAQFLASHGSICAICFNGKMAEKLYRQKVLPGLGGRAASIPLHGLPSTSPAHAAMPYAEKLAHWRAILQALLGETS